MVSPCCLLDMYTPAVWDPKVLPSYLIPTINWPGRNMGWPQRNHCIWNQFLPINQHGGVVAEGSGDPPSCMFFFKHFSSFCPLCLLTCDSSINEMKYFHADTRDWDNFLTTMDCGSYSRAVFTNSNGRSQLIRNANECPESSVLIQILLETRMAFFQIFPNLHIISKNLLVNHLLLLCLRNKAEILLTEPQTTVASKTTKSTKYQPR